MANPSTQAVTPQVTLQNNIGGNLPGVIKTGNHTIEAWLPHTYTKVHVYKQNGVPYIQVYIHTQSQYAPNGDSGNFVFDTEGNLVSGNPAVLSRLQNEAQEADPLVIAQTNGLFNWFKSHWHQMAGCGLLAGGAFLTGVAAVGSGGAALAAGMALFGGSVYGVFSHAATECF